MNSQLNKRILLVTFLGLALFLIQVAGQIEFLRSSPHAIHPAIVREGLEKSLTSFFFLAQAFWYLCLGTMAHAVILFIPITLASDITTHQNHPIKKRNGWTTVITLLFLGLLLLWNNVLFPFSDVAPNIYSPTIYPLAVYTALFVGLLTIWLLINPVWSKVVTASLGVSLLFLPALIPTLPIQPAKPNQTNVILIGIDSLRPDHLFHTPDKTLSLMPNLEAWLSNAIVYDDAVTPMARTFPALTSLLTAKYPAHNGARINLTADQQIDLRWTLAKHLKNKGYATAFAIDGARFVNISKAFGFDILQTPQQGLPDFIFGDVIDSVGTNLLNLFPISLWLNPVQYGNGAASASYRPAQFDYVLERLLQRLPSTSTFLMTHFDLAHLPYVRRNAFSAKTHSALPFRTYPPYERGLRATDRQFKIFVDALRRNNMLDNAVVVVYSDHGEEFNIDKDKTFRDKKNLIDGRLGHGSSIFSPSQSRILMAFQHFKDGAAEIAPEISYKPALLTDIAPTVMHLLEDRPELPESLDGMDLEGHIPLDRVRYMESSILFPDVTAGTIDRVRLLREFGHFFYITDSLRIRTKKDFANSPLKQTGAIRHNHVVGIAKTDIEQLNPRQNRTRWRSVAWPSLERTEDPAHTFLPMNLKDDVSHFFSIQAGQ